MHNILERIERGVYLVAVILLRGNQVSQSFAQSFVDNTFGLWLAVKHDYECMNKNKINRPVIITPQAAFTLFTVKGTL
jgi:hypothetical protein